MSPQLSVCISNEARVRLLCPFGQPIRHLERLGSMRPTYAERREFVPVSSDVIQTYSVPSCCWWLAWHEKSVYIFAIQHFQREDLMARVFITGSADGLGAMAAKLLVEEGHSVILHARNEARGKEALENIPGAETVVYGDLSSISQTKDVADQVNRLGTFDAVIHNAGIGYRESRRIATEDGLPRLFAVNTLAPYILTALIHRPARLVYLSSAMHEAGDATLNDLA